MSKKAVDSDQSESRSNTPIPRDTASKDKALPGTSGTSAAAVGKSENKTVPGTSGTSATAAGKSESDSGDESGEE